MIAISTNDLSFSVGTTVILDKVTFSLEENDKLGIIGVNGCGKSTLLRLLTGSTEPTSGEVYLSRGKTIGILTQDGAFDCENEDQTNNICYRAGDDHQQATQNSRTAEHNVQGAYKIPHQAHTDAQHTSTGCDNDLNNFSSCCINKQHCGVHCKDIGDNDDLSALWIEQ